MILRISAALVLMVLVAAPALAGPQYVGPSGYALAGYDPVAYFSLEQAPVGQRQPAPVAGKSSITAEYNGATWAFSSVENRERFLADPARYAPAYDGHCAYGVTKGGKVPGNPNLWRIVDGRLYVNIKDTVVGFWEADIPGNIATAQSTWPGIETAPAADVNPPDFASAAPLAD